MDPPQKAAFTAAVETLVLSAFYLGNASHAERAVELLRTWFLSNASRMNPNAKFAQGIPGQCDGAFFNESASVLLRIMSEFFSNIRV